MSESPLTPLSDSSSPIQSNKMNQQDQDENSFESIYDGLDDLDPVGVGSYEGSRENTRQSKEESRDEEEKGKEEGEMSDTSENRRGGDEEDQEIPVITRYEDSRDKEKEGETDSSRAVGREDLDAEVVKGIEAAERSYPVNLTRSDPSPFFTTRPSNSPQLERRPNESPSEQPHYNPALFVYRFSLPAASLIALLIGARGATVRATSEQAGVTIHYHGNFETTQALFSPPSQTPHGVIQGTIDGIKCALNLIKDNLEQNTWTHSHERFLCRDLEFLNFNSQNVEHLTKDNRLAATINRRSSSDWGHSRRDSTSARRTSDTDFAFQGYEEFEVPRQFSQRPDSVSPRAYRSRPARSSFSRPLDDDSPPLSSQSYRNQVDQYRLSRPSPSPLPDSSSHQRQRFRSPTPAQAYSPRLPSKSPSPPHPPARQPSSRPTLSVSTDLESYASDSLAELEQGKEGKAKIVAGTKRAQESFAIEIPIAAIPSFYGPQSSVPHLERISSTKLRLECETTSARLIVLTSNGAVKNLEKLKNGIKDVVRVAEGCESWFIPKEVEDQEMSPPPASPAVEVETRAYRYPSPISLQPQSLNAGSRPRSLSRSRSRPVTPQPPSRRHHRKDSATRDLEMKDRSQSRERDNHRSTRDTAVRSRIGPEEESSGRKRSRDEEEKGRDSRRGRYRSRSKDRRVERRERERSRSPRSTYSSTTPQVGRSGYTTFDKSIPNQTPLGRRRSRSPPRDIPPHFGSRSPRPRRMSPARLEPPPRHSAILSRPPSPSSTPYRSHDETRYAHPSSVTKYIGQPIHLTLNDEDRRRFEVKEQFERRMREEAQSFRQRQDGSGDRDRWGREERPRSPGDERRIADRGRKNRELRDERERSGGSGQGSRFHRGHQRTRHSVNEDVRRAF